MTKGSGGLANGEITEKCLKIARKYRFLSNSSGYIINFCHIMYFLQKKKVNQEEGGNKYVYKTDTEKERGVWCILTKLTKGGGGVGEMLKMADKEGNLEFGSSPILCLIVLSQCFHA